MMNTNKQTEPQDFSAIFATLDAIKRAWLTFATGPAPDDRQLMIWIRQQFSEAELIHAFRRVGAKFRNGLERGCPPGDISMVMCAHETEEMMEREDMESRL